MSAGSPKDSEERLKAIFTEVIQGLYEVAGRLKSRASILIKTWVVALLVSTIIPFVLFALAARTAREVMLGQASPADLAVNVVDAIIVSVIVSLLAGVAIFYLMVKFMGAGVEFSRMLAGARMLAKSGVKLGPGDASREAQPDRDLVWSYEGYYTIFKITAAASLIVSVVLVVLRGVLVGKVKSAVPETLQPGEAIDLWEVVSPILSLLILVGILNVALAFLRIYYGKSFFDALNREIQGHRSTGLYYAILEVLALVSTSVRDLIVTVLVLGALVFFLMDLKGLAEDAERYVGTVRAELRKALGVA